MNRTLLKTCSYAVMHLTVAIAVAYVVTGSWQIALAVGVVEPLVQTVAFAIHERLWSKTAKLEFHACSHSPLVIQKD